MSGALRAIGAVGGIAAMASRLIDFLSGRAQHAAGRAEERSAVQQETIEKLEEARKEKAQADEKVRATPYDEKVDKL